ncbi:ATP-binding protein [Pseudoneobacillus sp. C159]
MKEIKNKLNKRIYYVFVWIFVLMMIFGLFVDNPLLGKFSVGYVANSLLVLILSGCLLHYPKRETYAMRVTIIIVASVYFYTLFFIYPETWSTFIFLCFIPAISILYFDAKLFYFSMLLNVVFISLLFIYIIIIDPAHHHHYISEDIIGNSVNFIASQIIIYFIFYLTNVRIKQQQVYYEQIQQSERLKTTGELAAAVAHEIRNPLTVVKGFLQLFEQDTSVNEERKRHYQLMIDEVNTAEQVISQFLTMSKPNKEKATDTDVKVALQSVTDLLHSYGLIHDNRIELTVIGECHILANNIEIKQLFINIIKNAIEASKVGDVVRVTAEKEKDFVVIKVTDHGRGMSEAEVHSLGTPFYSLKSKGTGLGLMVCFNIVEKYKGTINFETSIGYGTTVKIGFPSLDK